MGIRQFIKNIFNPKKKAAVVREASGEIRVGQSAYAIASRRWRLFKSPRLRRIGIAARRGQNGMCPDAWFRPITNRKTPKPCSYSNAGAGRMRQKRRELADKRSKAESKKAAEPSCARFGWILR